MLKRCVTAKPTTTITLKTRLRRKRMNQMKTTKKKQIYFDYSGRDAKKKNSRIKNTTNIHINNNIIKSRQQQMVNFQTKTHKRGEKLKQKIKKAENKQRLFTYGQLKAAAEKESFGKGIYSSLLLN